MMKEELTELQSEKEKTLAYKHSTEEEEDREEVSSNVINSVMEKCSEFQDFFEKHHTNITVINRVLNLMKDNLVSHFLRVIHCRKKQVNLGRSFYKYDSADEKRRNP